MKVRITRRFTFEMAHALTDHEGPCRNIHGHSYILEVTLSGMPLKKDGDPGNGMVIDFDRLDQIVKERFVDKADHALMLSRRFLSVRQGEIGESGKLLVVPFEPTAENMVLYIAGLLRNAFGANAVPVRIVLCETARNSAEWCAEDH